MFFLRNLKSYLSIPYDIDLVPSFFYFVILKKREIDFPQYCASKGTAGNPTFIIATCKIAYGHSIL